MASEAQITKRRKSEFMRPWTSPVKNGHKPPMEKRLLQLAILIGGIVPVSAGFEGATRGARFMGSWPGQGADSEFRYLSGLGKER